MRHITIINTLIKAGYEYVKLDGGRTRTVINEISTDPNDKFPIKCQIFTAHGTPNGFGAYSTDFFVNTFDVFSATPSPFQTPPTSHATFEEASESPPGVPSDPGYMLDLVNDLWPEQNMSKTDVLCECGAEKCGMAFHSDWCPIKEK